MKFILHNADGSSKGEKEIKDFPSLDGDKGLDALRQTIIAIHANQRQGNASTKLRSEVAGSGKKIYRQKGLGVGRAGDKRAIQRRGGGVIFGPRPRSYNQKINRKIKLLALKRALNDAAVENRISVIEEWSLSEMKTKAFKQLLSNINLESKKCLLISDEFSKEFQLAARNYSKARLCRVCDLNPLLAVQADQMVFSSTGMNALIEKLNGVSKEKI